MIPKNRKEEVEADREDLKANKGIDLENLKREHIVNKKK